MFCIIQIQNIFLISNGSGFYFRIKYNIAAIIKPITTDAMIVVVGSDTPVAFPVASVFCSQVGFQVYKIT